MLYSSFCNSSPEIQFCGDSSSFIDHDTWLTSACTHLSDQGNTFIGLNRFLETVMVVSGDVTDPIWISG
jgi:hypothetical protein